MSVSSMSTAFIPDTLPTIPAELVKFEVERGQSNGSISIEQTNPSSSPCIDPDLINLNLRDTGRSSSAQESSLSNRRFEMSNGRNSRLTPIDLDIPLFSTSLDRSLRNSEELRKLSEDFQKLVDSLDFDEVSYPIPPPSKKLNGEEVAETLLAEASFTIATDKKPIVATWGCGPCVALGGYDATNKIAFIVHFSNQEEVIKSGDLIFSNIAKLVKEKITTPIQLHLRGGIEDESEPIIEAIKMWMKQREDLPMEIASEDVLDRGPDSKSLSVDSRTGEVSEYNPMDNPKSRGMSDLEIISAIMNARYPQIKLAYSPK